MHRHATGKVETITATSSDRRRHLHPDTGNLEWEVLDTYKHDRLAFTQGFHAKDGIMYEGTGLYGKSQLRKVDIATGKVLRRVKLDKSKFGEGITLMDGDTRIVQLTWKSRTGYVRDVQTFDKIREFQFSTVRNEGWGITYDEKNDQLFVSDGSEHLFVWNGRTLKEERRMVVVDENGNAVPKLNELEWYKGTILANVWYDDRLLQINPTTGHIMKSWNFKKLVRRPQEYHQKQDCFNGIALVDGGNQKELYLTGKLWRRVYKVYIPGLMTLEME